MMYILIPDSSYIYMNVMFSWINMERLGLFQKKKIMGVCDGSFSLPPPSMGFTV